MGVDVLCKKRHNWCVTWTFCSVCNKNVDINGNSALCIDCGSLLSVSQESSLKINPSPTLNVTKPISAVSDVATNGSNVASSSDQPTYQQMQTLINEVRDLKGLVDILRWAIPIGFITIILHMWWFGVKVNLSPTIFTSLP